MKNKKTVLIVSALLIGVGAYYIYVMNKKSNVELVPELEAENTLDTTKVLSKGSTGEEVKRLQKALGTLKVDGDFGVLTEKRLKAITGKTSISLREYNLIIADKKAKNIK
jgi:hypothetical protein